MKLEVEFVERNRCKDVTPVVLDIGKSNYIKMGHNSSATFEPELDLALTALALRI